MARQQDSCWRCGAVWAEATADIDRWGDEGGSTPPESPPAVLIPALAQR